MKKILFFAALTAALFAACSEDRPVQVQYSRGAPYIGKPIPDRELDVYHRGKIGKIRTSRYRGKWLILFFYPADFTFVCPTELKDMSEHYAKFRKAGAEVVSISTDSVYVHRAWAEQNEDIKKIPYPMASDRPGLLSRELGTYDAAKGVSVRASFIVSPEGNIVAYELTDEAIGRSATDLLRKLEAAVAVRESDGGFCPANWHAGEDMITPR